MDGLNCFQLVKPTRGRAGSTCPIYKVNKFNAHFQAEPYKRLESLWKQEGTFNMVFAAVSQSSDYRRIALKLGNRSSSQYSCTNHGPYKGTNNDSCIKMTNQWDDFLGGPRMVLHASVGLKIDLKMNSAVFRFWFPSRYHNTKFGIQVKIGYERLRVGKN